MSKLIETLTPAQEAQIPKYLEEYRKVGTSTEATDRVLAERAILASYEYLKLEKPMILWADDPIQGAKMAQEYSSEPMSDPASFASCGSFEAYWVSTYAFVAEVLEIKKDNLIDIVKDIVKNCGIHWTFEGLAILTPKPSELHFNNEGGLHNETNLAIKYPSGFGWYSLNGHRHGSLAELSIANRYKNEKEV